MKAFKIYTDMTESCVNKELMFRSIQACQILPVNSIFQLERQLGYLSPSLFLLFLTLQLTPFSQECTEI